MRDPDLLRTIPSVDEILRRPRIAALARIASPALLAAWVREALAEVRARVREGAWDEAALAAGLDALAPRVEGRVAGLRRAPVRRVINATGVLIHTNLGRAPLGRGALEAMLEAGAGYSNLEYDLARGERGSRGAHLEAAGAALFPGHALVAVNNNAAAVLLALNALAEGKEAIVSRGELVEIGGSFRIPDVMEKAGVTLREVGTTNRTRLADYRGAISERTGLFVKVHASNYRIVGFVEETPIEALAGLARERAIPLLVDQGSGSLVPSRESGLPDEASVAELLAQGASLVTFSGDKLLGGPQAGLIVGDPALVARCARNPLARALRLDKTRIATLAWTLAEHASGRARQSVPVLEMLDRSVESIAQRARALAVRLESLEADLDVKEGTSRVGGGAAPLQDVPTVLLAVRPRSRSAASCEAALRSAEPPVIARIEDERILIDLRTVSPDEDVLVEGGLRAALRSS